MALAAMAGTAMLIRWSAPPPYVRVASEKLEHFLRHRGEYDVLFVGPSTTYRHISPAEFDAVTAKYGVPTRSFNFGVPSMSSWEILQQLERIGGKGVSGPRWMVIDVGNFTRGTREVNLKTQRNIQWHTLRPTWQLSRTWASERFGETQMLHIYRHWVAFFYNLGNVGVLSRLVFGETSPDASLLGPARDGWSPLGSGEAGRRSGFLANLDQYEESVIALAASQEFAHGLKPGTAELLERLIEAARLMGAEPVFITPPTSRLMFELEAAERIGLIQHHLAFNDPHQFPELYRIADRFDRDHLNEEAARRYTQHVAAAFLQVVRRRQ